MKSISKRFEDIKSNFVKKDNKTNMSSFDVNTKEIEDSIDEAKNFDYPEQIKSICFKVTHKITSALWIKTQNFLDTAKKVKWVIQNVKTRLNNLNLDFKTNVSLTKSLIKKQVFDVLSIKPQTVRSKI